VQISHTGALSSKAKGSFLILEYQKSSATLSLATQLWAREKFLTSNITVRSWVRVWWMGDDFWYSSMRNPPATPSPSELSKQSKLKPTNSNYASRANSSMPYLKTIQPEAKGIKTVSNCLSTIAFDLQYQPE
jgi:hypothetical protein